VVLGNFQTMFFFIGPVVYLLVSVFNAVQSSSYDVQVHILDTKNDFKIQTKSETICPNIEYLNTLHVGIKGIDEGVPKFIQDSACLTYCQGKFKTADREYYSLDVPAPLDDPNSKSGCCCYGSKCATVTSSVEDDQKQGTGTTCAIMKGLTFAFAIQETVKLDDGSLCADRKVFCDKCCVKEIDIRHKKHTKTYPADSSTCTSSLKSKFDDKAVLDRCCCYTVTKK